MMTTLLKLLTAALILGERMFFYFQGRNSVLLDQKQKEEKANAMWKEIDSGNTSHDKQSVLERMRK